MLQVLVEFQQVLVKLALFLHQPLIHLKRVCLLQDQETVEGLDCHYHLAIIGSKNEFNYRLKQVTLNGISRVVPVKIKIPRTFRMRSTVHPLLRILCIFETILILVLRMGLHKAGYVAFQQLFREIPLSRPMKKNNTKRYY